LDTFYQAVLDNEKDLVILKRMENGDERKFFTSPIYFADRIVHMDRLP
jgi:hypothetical protein